jgi:uncharacterized protein YecE (DUF72 family)
MEFGKIEQSDLASVSFTLPPDHPDTTAVLAKRKGKKKTEIFIGCAKWGRKDWVGTLYPPKTKEADFLNHYATHFNCIELNSTFYRMPTVAQITNWKNKVGNDFKFCPKFVDKITHLRRLKNVKELTDEFLTAISAFDKNLGPIFLMPHPQMGPKTLDTIQSFIESMPTEIELFIELRHTEWYSNAEAYNKAFSLFNKLKTGSIITDASGRRDCAHMRLTTPQAFVRFVGNGLHPSDYTRIDDWVQRIKQWMEQGIERIWFFMHQHEELHSPELCRYLIPEINKHCGTNIPDIKFVS